MKKLIVVMLSIVLFVGCSNNPKGRIELSIEDYVAQNFVDPKDYKGIASISQTDSTNILGVLQGLAELEDSIDNMERWMLDTINTYLPKTSYSYRKRNAVEFASVIMSSLLEIQYHPNRKKMREAETRKALNVADTSISTMRSYVAKIKISGNTEVTPYYITDCALLDSVIVSSSPILVQDMPDVLRAVCELIDKNQEIVGQKMAVLQKMSDIKNSIMIEINHK
ncbi:MAG: hypothetical protein NC301_09320 [Bacteroides sp.]|nr:hypothetical protein [Alistipes timonensis]MCM1311201.1 hypothetical protein [Bacteroides sp.]MCM1406515.1 hypothetical protein [[Clostridium] fimetarium]